jgi:prophage regulatory protein
VRNIYAFQAAPWRQKFNSSQLPTSDIFTARPLPDVFLSIIEVALAAKEIEVLRIAQVSKKTGQGASTLWLAVKGGTFPPPIKLSQRSVAWINAEINAVLTARVLASRSRTEIDMKQFVALLIAPRTLA